MHNRGKGEEEEEEAVTLVKKFNLLSCKSIAQTVGQLYRWLDTKI